MERLKLNTPIKIKSRFNFVESILITEVEIQKPTISSFLGLDFVTPEKQFESIGILISRLTSLKGDSWKNLDIEDFNLIASHLSKYLNK